MYLSQADRHDLGVQRQIAGRRWTWEVDREWAAIEVEVQGLPFQI